MLSNLILTMLKQSIILNQISEEYDVNNMKSYKLKVIKKLINLKNILNASKFSKHKVLI